MGFPDAFDPSSFGFLRSCVPPSSFAHGRPFLPLTWGGVAVIFVDWMTLYQARRPGTIPVAGSEFRVSHSLETGELLREQVVGFQHLGSFDSSLHVRSDGGTVLVSGNPSAFDRPDNLFGWHSVPASVDRVNRELSLLGLPEFDSFRAHEERRSGSTVAFRSLPSPAVRGSQAAVLGYFADVDNGRQSAHADAVLPDERARLTRVDLTQNLSTSDAPGFLRHLSTYVHHGKVGYLYPNGRTVEWGKGSRRIYIKYYDKAFDIQQKILKLSKSATKNCKHRSKLIQHIEYLSKLMAWCEENGIVRLEVSFKSTELIDRHLIFIESWSPDVMSNVLHPYQFHEKLNISETRFQGVADWLIAGGLSERVARQAELIHTAWVNGSDVSMLCGTERNFRRYRNYLLGVGVDIKNPCDISRLVLRAHRSECREVSPPDWYVMPGQESTKPYLKIVA